jgi:hypothetical protein
MGSRWHWQGHACSLEDLVALGAVHAAAISGHACLWQQALPAEVREDTV